MAATPERSLTLSTTHYALLSLLSLGPASAYDLVAQMKRSVGAVWPRADSNIYNDLKRLADDGLASTRVQHTGKRARTTYRISARGTAALRRWLTEPGAPPVFESEALLKLSFAPLTSKHAAIAQVEAIAAHAEQHVAFGRAMAQQYLDGDGPLPARLHINAVMWRYLWEMRLAAARWAQWAREEIDAWPDTQDSTHMRARGLAALRDGLAGADVLRPDVGSRSGPTTPAPRAPRR